MMKKILTLLIVWMSAAPIVVAQEVPRVTSVPRQPLLAQIHRLAEALDVIGSPLDQEAIRQIQELKSLSDDAVLAAKIQQLLDPLCLAIVEVQAEGPPTVTRGPAKAELLEQGWRTFLVKVLNPTKQSSRLLIESPNSRPLAYSPADQVASRWMQMSSFDGQPMRPNLSGLGLEYRIVQIYSRDTGSKNALLEFTVSSGSGAASELVREWRFDRDSDGWHAMNQCEIKVEDGALSVHSSGEDPYMGALVESRGGPMTLRFWANSDQAGIGQVFWWTKEQPQASGDRQTNFVLEPGKDHLYEIPFSVEGTLAGVRLDPMVQPGNMRIEWIDLYSARKSENWARLKIDFVSVPSTQVTFRVIDQQGLPGFGKFEIRDSRGRIYPAQSKRLAPDFFFQRHIYRGDQEQIALPPGTYTVICSRGPETIPETKTLEVGDQPTELEYRVQRWVEPAATGWWSGDHHIHAAGCLHYENPTQGVMPEDMIRHIMGEDLKVGCCLTWGPCFDFQKRFFTGEVAEESRYPYTLRYDVEVSGFGSHMSGHLNLLNLREQIYPGGESKDHWPTLGLNTLRWAKRQGAVCGPAHSAIGLNRHVGRLPETEGQDGPHGLPNFNVPAFDGIGANEFIVDVTHKVTGPTGAPVPAVDFISAMNTERVAEWNMWYHVLNSGFRVAVSGETDFPCVSGERVGIGRVYAQVDGELNFQKWVNAVAAGRSYVSDGTCHLLDFQVTNRRDGSQTRLGIDDSEMSCSSNDELVFKVSAAARQESPEPLMVELIVNGYPVERQKLPADGETRELQFHYRAQASGWVALRTFPNAHTNPIYITVDAQPFQGVLDSLRWCRASVEQCWKSKQPTYALEEIGDAKAAYDHARRVFESRMAALEE